MGVRSIERWAECPDTSLLALTGSGAAAVRELCMELGRELSQSLTLVGTLGWNIAMELSRKFER